MMIRFLFATVLFSALLFICSVNAFAEDKPSPNKVELKKTDQGWQLLRNGKEYFIKGAGGSDHLEELVKRGGNSIRTWGTDNIQPLLDKAHKLGLTVTVGFWLGHERHGFKYSDSSAIIRQHESILKTVREIKDHPAVLCWGIGNEMEAAGTNPGIWYAIDHIARDIKAIDKNHPTMTVIAELGDVKPENLHRFCPNIDIVGLNTYGGAFNIMDRYKKRGGTKPVIITEFGPLGFWEVGKTPWGAPIEMSSTEKGKRYTLSYQKSIAGKPGECLGSYAFVWGNKQEKTATWFGMFLKDGSVVAPVEAIGKAWGGPTPDNYCPVIEKYSASKTNNLAPRESFTAKIEVTDPDEDTLTTKWLVLPESTAHSVGGDFEKELKGIDGTVQESSVDSVTVSAPQKPGAYRLFAYIYDGKGNAATLNIPFFVKGKVTKNVAKPEFKAPKGELPFIVYEESETKLKYYPSGFMGDTGNLSVKLDETKNPHSGKTCIRCAYNSGTGWGGVVWQSPANDWGEKPGGYNLTGATRLEFWIRGEKGGEKLQLQSGIIEKDKPYPDSMISKLSPITLTKEWQKLTIPLEGRDLSQIKSALSFALAPKGQPIIFYLDDIKFVKTP